MESIKTINSAVRTILATVVIGGVGFGSWFGYTTYRGNEIELSNAQAELKTKNNTIETLNGQLSEKDKLLTMKEEQLAEKDVELAEKDNEISALNVDIEEKKVEIARLETSLHLLKVTHRLARLTVIDQITDEETGEIKTVVEFVEVNDDGQPIDVPRKFDIKGDVVYVDNWVVKFDDKYIEQADIDRSTSLCLFRRIFGEFQEPNEGYELDRRGTRPTAYARGGEMTPFERKIWDDFWNIANDPAKAKQLGIRAAHGEAVSIKVRKGKAYKVLLRSTGDLSLAPDEMATVDNRPPQS
jgi:hypothetical protein